MTARILDGKDLARRERERIAAEARELAGQGITPGLAVVLVGEDPASAVYVRNKERAAKKTGVATFDHRLPAETSEADLLALMDRLNQDDAVHGILVQLPLPPGIDAARVLAAISPAKDVDGFHAQSLGHLVQGTPGFVACTPRGCMRLLEESGTQLRGARAVVIGRSNIVGKPMGLLLLAADATVTMTHRQTRGLDEEVGRADVVVAAVGRPEFVRGEWIKPGAVVIDVGINRLSDGTLVGDVEFAAAKERAAAITPVPGGVGPMTIAMLLGNTVESARRHGAK